MAGHYFNTVENTVTGKPVAGATVKVYTSAAVITGSLSAGYTVTGTLATIFSDDGVTQINQSSAPLTSDSGGFFQFWTNETSVVLLISYDGSGKRAISDVEILGGSVSSDVTALATRMDAVEVVTQDATVVAFKGLTGAADKVPYFTGVDTMALADFTAAGRALVDDANASAQRTTLSAAAAAQTAEMIAGFITSPSNKSYTIVLKMAHAGTITETTTKSASGTCTATFKVNSTALGGTANSVSSSEQSQAHAATNTFVAGDDIVLTVSANSTCVDMSFSIKYTRTLE